MSPLTKQVITNHTKEAFSFEDENGKQVGTTHTVTHSSGRTFRFDERDIFDFGRVINPAYEVCPGHGPGGLIDVKNGVYGWMSFFSSVYRLIDGSFQGSWEECFARASSEPAPGRTIRETPRRSNLFTLGPTFQVLDSNGNPVNGTESQSSAATAAKWSNMETVSLGGWRRVADMDPDEKECYLAVCAGENPLNP